ncbi:unnamed protein product, partial [Rotaria sordida]
MPVPVSQVQETYIQPTGTVDYTREIYESQKPIYDYRGAEQQPSQYLYNVGDVQQQQQQAAQQETVQYTSEVARPYLVPGADIQHIEQKQIIDHVPVAPTSVSYYEQQPMPVPVSQVQETYIQPTGTVDYTREIYES